MELSQNTVTTLRVLSRKSKIGFGKHHDLTVADLLIADRQYLIWLYYNNAMISFASDIVDELELIPIAKPGTDKAAHREYRKRQSEKYTEEERLHWRYRKSQISRSVAKSKLARVITATSFSKGELQAINHGKL